ncbi:MAG: DnaJ domain-containing protein [Rhodobacteraceae bacterium]|nr:DnaJ domain-containing protein [Paracoccaceae bacterium]MCY4250763.1 DnaJ domain-containing protein [Paracoccaceae bacterium]MCY4307231.1 DnaJ domain-containing protein [Paracoccaceae bacterium]
MKKDYLDFDISVSAAKKKKNISRKSFPGEEDTQRPCHVAGCNRMGKYKAPASPDNLNEFIWFCKKHIATYNTQWNYYEQKTKSTNNDFVLDGKSGHSQFQWSNFKVNDPFDLVEEDNTNHHSIHASKTIRLSKTEQRASEILDLEGNFSKSDARKRYRILVKDLHPDMNNGNRSDEDRLKEVVWAWDQIKRSRKIPDP